MKKIICFAMLVASSAAFAQSGNIRQNGLSATPSGNPATSTSNVTTFGVPPGVPGGGVTPDDPNLNVPIDGGIGFLLLGAGALGAARLRRKEKEV
ncbi:PID-CTERM protein-sorting domain-containing protein [Persicobacter diffluens]